MHRVRKYAIYLGTTLLLPLVSLSLRIIGLRQTCRFLGVTLVRNGDGGTGQLDAVEASLADQIHAIVHRVARILPFSPQCLPRSTTVCCLLNRFHLQNVLRISVNHQDATLQAHAWVECGNVPLGEPDPITKGLQPFS